MKIKTKKAPAKVAKTSNSAKSKKVVSKRKSKRNTPRRPVVPSEAVSQTEMASLAQQAQEIESFIEQQKIDELFKALESLDGCTKTEAKTTKLTENDIVAVKPESLLRKVLNSWKGITFLSVLATIVIALIVSTLFAAETVNDVRVLAQKVTSESKLTAVIYTLASDPRSKGLFSIVEQYEAQDPSVKFFIAPIENPEMLEFFKLFQINTIPTMIFSLNGDILASVTGQAATVEDLARVIKQVKDSLKKGKVNGK